MVVTNLRLVDNVKNTYYAEVNGVPITFGTGGRGSPEDALAKLLVGQK
jgi:hypothetical protein